LLEREVEVAEGEGELDFSRIGAVLANGILALADPWPGGHDDPDLDAGSRVAQKRPRSRGAECFGGTSNDRICGTIDK
jgi:hypothetical protein